MSEGLRKGILHKSRHNLVVERSCAAGNPHMRKIRVAEPRFVWLFALLVWANFAHRSESANLPLSTRGFHSNQLRAGLNCAPSLGVLGCLRLNEPLAAQRHTVELKRTGLELCLPLKSARKTCFRDRDGVSYAFLERVNDYFVIVEVDGIHGYAVLMVNETTGRLRRVDNRPLFARHGSFFATVSYDTDAGYLPNRVVIWDSTKSTPVYTADKFGPGTGPIAIRWTAPDRLTVLYSRTADSPNVTKNTEAFSVWKDRSGAWRDNYVRD